MKKVDIKSATSLIILNISGLNPPIRQRVGFLIKQCEESVKPLCKKPTINTKTKLLK
jgi:hypothetical protein